ncbi:MAG: UDP-N-acetylglucosamine--N-acetylmuramyl-(pentapeptide) pyrophosphoryl-undecaprenol N-acetylglucosamine transferase [Opitutales bacterium]|nr:UDP-N-acetylglucosamine--N-acetylmuramyl-(pentapeptide) pyrophosphoryl-undecaprenol N-acetylglucosamine transferase [Opitutales bacterium]|tara:strand:- start:101 stop:1237 length:1137 start_codon:yes stop_codon:yes gene_type:complete
MSNILIACGGTGGHLAPGISLAQAMEERDNPCWLFISHKQVDSRLAEKYGDLSFVRVAGTPFSRNPLKFALFAKELTQGVLFSLRFFRKAGIDCVFGFGGYSSVAPVLAAKIRGIPYFLHEANRAVGKTTKTMASGSARTYLPEGVRIDGLSPGRSRHCGYPVRREIRRMARGQARRKLGIRSDERLLVVIGGSQGAASLNLWVKRNAERLAAEGIGVYVITGTGNESEGVVELNGDRRKVTARFVPFCDDMAALLSSADVVVSRAGAGSIAEITRCRVPSVLVPYPHAADDHQRLNAGFMESKGAAIVCEESNLDNLFDEVRELCFNDELQTIVRRNLDHAEKMDPLSFLASDMDDYFQEKEGERTRTVPGLAPTLG